MNRTQSLYARAKRMIPGGTQLLTKRPEMHLPGLWPAYYRRARGCEVWDLDNRKYVDMSYMGIGSCILGYAAPVVNAAVTAALRLGSMTTLNAPEEVELADLLLELHPWAQRVRYARTGGEAMSLAVRIARAQTGRDVVLFSGYHGWHDWYLSSNLADRRSLDGHLLPGLSPFGVPRALRGTAYPFAFNDTNAFRALLAKHGRRVGAVILEGIRNDPPSADFLASIRRLTKERGIVLIIDEITSGWRLNLGGAHLLFGLKPDMAVFAKGISNGVPMAAVIGHAGVMDKAQDSFISSTYWTERLGPAAALATIRAFKRHRVQDHLGRMGSLVQQGWRAAAVRQGLRIKVGGMLPLGHFSFEHDQPLTLKTLFTQSLLERGFLATTAFYASYAHKERHVRAYLTAVEEAFSLIARALSRGNVERCLKGPVCHAGFKRLT